MLTDEIYQMYIDKGLKNAEIVADSAEKRLITEIKRKGISNIKPSVKRSRIYYARCSIYTRIQNIRTSIL